MKHARQSKWFVQVGDQLAPCGTRTQAERQYDGLVRERPVTPVALLVIGSDGLHRVRAYADGVERRS